MAVERQFSSADMEAIISRLKDVVAVSVVDGPDGNPAEIHVLADSSRLPKQVVRDIESALMARLGYHVDHKIISVAQVDSSSGTSAARLKFSDVSVSLNGNHSEVTVRLAKDGAIYCGSASGGGTPTGQMKLIAEATLRAIEDSGMISGGLALEDVGEFPIGTRRVAVVTVCVTGGRGDDTLSGCAIIRQDIWKGVVNATLDAVNRRLAAAGM